MSQTSIACYIWMTFYRSRCWRVLGTAACTQSARDAGNASSTSRLCPSRSTAQVFERGGCSSASRGFCGSLGPWVCVFTVLRLYEFHSVLIFHVNIENLSPQTSLCGLKTHLTNCQIVFSIERTHEVWSALFPSVQDVCEWILTNFSYYCSRYYHIIYIIVLLLYPLLAVQIVDHHYLSQNVYFLCKGWT